MRALLCTALLGASLGGAPVLAQHAQPWSYHDAIGPGHWAGLDPQFRACGEGRRQSPVDIVDARPIRPSTLEFDYAPGVPEIVNTGHTVQLNVNATDVLRVDGARYVLEQLHFHTPSEHRIEGRRYDLEAHLVHRDARGRIAVVAVLFETGAPHAMIERFWTHVPERPGAARVEGFTLDPRQILPGDSRHFRLEGSLTTPPCSEGVRWFVLQTPVSVSAAQLEGFKRIYHANSRPAQPLNGRRVEVSQ